MNSVASPKAADPGLRQMARCPRDSDGVGSALRQVFGRTAGLPTEIDALLRRLNQND